MDFSESYDCLIHSYAPHESPASRSRVQRFSSGTKHERSFEVVLASTVGVIKARISLHGPCVIRGGNLAPTNDQQSACSNFLRCSPTKPRLASTWSRGPRLRRGTSQKV